RGVALALGHTGLERLVERRERRLGRPQLGRLGVLLQPFALAVADQRDDRRLAREEPSEAELRRRAAFVRGELLERVDELLVLLRVAALEARHAAASVVLRQVGSRNRAREKAAAQRRVGEEADAELVRDGE